MELKTRFLGLVSHEMRTPLATLMLQLERMRIEQAEQGTTGDTRGEPTPVDRMMVSARRLQSLMDGLIQYVRIESGRLDLDVEPFDLSALVADVVEELRPRAEQKELALTLEAAPEVPPLASDPRLLRLVVANLVGNAIEYTARGSVRVSVDHHGDAHRIAVTDTGPGIPPEQQARILRAVRPGRVVARQARLGRGPRAHARPRPAERPRCFTRISTRRSAGALRSPCASAHSRTRRMSRTERHRRSGERRRPMATNETVLLVDDDAEVREQLAFLLGRRGHRVLTAKHGLDAIEVLRKTGPPCLMILDLMMPVMDGWTLRRELLREAVWADIPVVLLSGVADIDDEAKELCAVDYLEKPIDLERLYRIVADFC